VYGDAKVLIAPALTFTNTSSEDQYNVQLESSSDIITKFTDPSATDISSASDRNNFDLNTSSPDNEKQVGIIIDTENGGDNADELVITISETNI
jgi:hypothetical protein